jgi:hypothetical protein
MSIEFLVISWIVLGVFAWLLVGLFTGGEAYWPLYLCICFSPIVFPVVVIMGIWEFIRDVINNKERELRSHSIDARGLDGSGRPIIKNGIICIYKLNDRT